MLLSDKSGDSFLTKTDNTDLESSDVHVMTKIDSTGDLL
jgi:hypothetical protein